MTPHSQSVQGIATRHSFPCALAEVRMSAQAVRSFLEEQGLHPDELMACELALTEACNNAVENAPESKRNEPIEIHVSCNGSTVEFQVTDHTPGFAWPEKATLPDPERERGRGLFIIKSLMDEVSYFRGTGENILAMRKRRCYQTHRLSCPELTSPKETRLKLTECQNALSNMAKELCFRSETLAAMFRRTADLGRTQSLEDFAARLLNDLVIITGADWFVLRLVSAGSRQLEVFAASEPEAPLEPQTIPSRDQAVAFVECRAAATGEDVWFDDRRLAAPDDPIRLAHPNSVGLIHPFFFGETLVGTLAIGRHHARCHFTLEQAEVAHTFGEFLAIQVENSRLQEKHLHLRLVSRELEIARDIQRALLPKSLPEFRGFGLAAFYESAREVGGDFCDVLPLSDHNVWLVVADVMGKGVPAAMFAAILRSLVRAIWQWVERPSGVLAQLNRLLFDELSRVDMFITAQLALLDLQKRQMMVAGAGHCPALLADAARAETQAVATEGLPLGVIPNAVYRDVTVRLGPGCRILLHTDGVSEARNVQGERFGQPRLMAWLNRSKARRSTANVLKTELAEELVRFQSPGRLHDDQTFLLLAQEDAA